MRKLSLNKETLVELSSTELTSVVGAGESCFQYSCITNDLSRFIDVKTQPTTTTTGSSV
jgi:hypothetical protein